jgi:predicted secreted acid phosphatase
VVLAAVAFALAACTQSGVTPSAESGFVTVTSQPPNVGDAKIAALKYYESGQYAADLVTVAGQAQAWLDSRAGAVTRPAAVFDIDETALSNWEVLRRDDFGRPIGGPCDVTALDAPCGWAAWDLLGRDKAIQPTLDLYRHGVARGVTVFFITGRPESQRAATARNLAAVGYGKYETLYLVPDGAHFASAADYKAPIRARIEQAGYTIIMNIGDQPSDLQGGHAEKSFLLPDPFYRVP